MTISIENISFYLTVFILFYCKKWGVSNLNYNETMNVSIYQMSKLLLLYVLIIYIYTIYCTVLIVKSKNVKLLCKYKDNIDNLLFYE